MPLQKQEKKKMSDEERQEIEGRLDKSEEDFTELRKIQDLFEMEGWDALKRWYSKHFSDPADSLLKEEGFIPSDRLQGLRAEIVAYEKFLSLDKAIESEIKSVVSEAQAIQTQLSEEADPGSQA